MKSSTDYGKSAFEVTNGEQRTRVFYQSVYDVNEHKLGLNKYEIKGDAHNIKNWELTEKIRSDYQWY